jgi:hypothetical protein
VLEAVRPVVVDVREGADGVRRRVTLRPGEPVVAIG